MSGFTETKAGHNVGVSAALALALSFVGVAGGQPAARPTVQPVTFGQDLHAPLAGVGRSRDFADWDGDALLDLVMLLHPRYTGSDLETAVSKLILVRNIGTRTSPLFEPAERGRTLLEDPRLGYHFALIDYDGDGKKEVVAVKDRLVRFFIPTQEDWSVLKAVETSGDPLRLAVDAQEDSPTIGVADWDGDGKDDLLLGANRPKTMGRGFGVNREEFEPLAARVYWAKNLSAGNGPVFAEPVVLEADGKPIESFGFVYPIAHDLDGDKLPDLILGEHRPGIRVFRNVGERGKPRLAYAGLVEQEPGSPIATSLAFQVRAADLDSDGRRELVATSYFGSPSLMMHLKRAETSQLHRSWTVDGFLQMQADAETALAGPGISTPEPVDWDGDGDTDLLLGGEPGTPMIAINVGSEKDKVFNAPKRLLFVDGTPLETYSSEIGDGSHHGPKEWYDDRSTPRAADWDGDGVLDIVSGTQGRRLYWMKGEKVRGELRFRQPQLFRLGGKPLLHPHRCLPAVTDWNGDGRLDIVGFDVRSDLTVYLGDGDSDLKTAAALTDEAGRPISASTKIKDPDIGHTRSGRSGVAVADWDGDGERDLITFKHYFDGGVLYYRGLGRNRFEQPVRLFDFFSHLAGPSLVDWNLDGRPDILMGGDYRRLVGLTYQMPTDTRAHYFVYDGGSLSVPSAEARSSRPND